MAKLLGTDQFLINRDNADTQQGGTFKVDFASLQDSLEIVEYSLGVEVLEDEDGAVEDYPADGGNPRGLQMTNAGGYFNAGRSYSTYGGNGSGASIGVTKVLANNNEIDQYTLTDGGSGYAAGDTIKISPFGKAGALYNVDSIVDPGDAGLALLQDEDNSISSLVIIGNISTDDEAYDTTPGALNVADSATLVLNSDGTALELGAQGFAYEHPGTGTLGYVEEDINGDFNLIELTGSSITMSSSYVLGVDGTGALSNIDYHNSQAEASFTVNSTTDGQNQGDIRIFLKDENGVEVGNEAFFKPGNGIGFANSGDPDQVVINNTKPFEGSNDTGSGGGGFSGGVTIVGEFPPQSGDPSVPGEEFIEEGTLWYNTSDGRLYVLLRQDDLNAVPPIYRSVWVDASPSAINDVVRRTGGSPGGDISGKITINNTLYAEHLDIENLPILS